jgi:hypothetical protein
MTVSRIFVHPDVIRVADRVITALQALEAEMSATSYHLGGSVIQLMIDEVSVATIEWHADSDAWCLVQCAEGPPNPAIDD